MRTVSRFWIMCVVLALAVGLVGGAVWEWLYKFPFPQRTEFKTRLLRWVRADIPGRWGEARHMRDDKNLTEEQRRKIQELRSVGYVAGSMPAPPNRDVTVYDATRAYDGLNLVVSGHAPEAILMDMSGEIIHKWACDVFRAWPYFDTKAYYGSTQEQLHTFWRRAHLMENGDLLAIFEGIGLIRLDKHSNLIWGARNGAHHDLYVARNGDIYVLTRQAHINQKYNEKKPILEDFITVLSSNGEELKSISILEILQDSPYASVMRRLRPFGDILHTNTIELVEGNGSDRLRAFREGTVLISILRLDLVCAVDLEDKSVYWAESDLWHRQHQSTLLDNGNMLVLDNKGLTEDSIVLEFDPISRKRIWSYSGGRDGEFWTKSCGSCQRLPNGNTLITESDPGRAFEVTPDKSIVWEYTNPHRAGKNGELIATLFEVVRLGQDFSLDWLPPRTAQEKQVTAGESGG